MAPFETDFLHPAWSTLFLAGQKIDRGTRADSYLRINAMTVFVNPKLLFLNLVAPSAVPPAFRRRMEHYRCLSGSFRMNVALKELPDFTCIPGKHIQEHHKAGIIIAPSLDYMDEAFQEV